MSRYFGFASWVGFVAALGVSTLAGAQSVKLIELAWTAPSGCPGASAVERRVAELTGALARTTPLRATASVSAVEGGVQLHLETQDAGQTFIREVMLPSCEQAAETAALIFAMALRAELEESAPTSPTNTTPEPAPVDVATPQAPSAGPEPTAASTSGPSETAPKLVSAADAAAPEPASAGSEPSPKSLAPAAIASPSSATAAQPLLPQQASTLYRFAATLAGTAVWSLLPESLWAVSATAAWLPLKWRLEVTGSFAPAQRYTLSSDTSRGGEFVWWSAGARACYRLYDPLAGGSPLGAFVCLGAEGGQLRGAGFGTTLDDEGVSPWVAVNGGLGGTLELLERLRLLARIELAAPLWRDRFVLQNTEGAGLVARPSRLVAKLALGLEVPF